MSTEISYRPTVRLGAGLEETLVSMSLPELHAQNCILYQEGSDRVKAISASSYLTDDSSRGAGKYFWPR